MATETEADILKRVTPEQIEEEYRRGYISAATRNKVMHKKARATVGGLLEEKGFIKAVGERTVQHIQDGWDNLKEAATRTPTDKPTTELYYAGLAMWGQIQILTSIFNAFGEVTGQEAENAALFMGASPGVARVINISVDIGTGFLPLATAVKSGVKGTQTILKGRQAKAAARAEAATVKAGFQAEFESVRKALVQGLEAEGVKGADKAIVQSAEAAGVTVAKGAEEGAEAAGKVLKEGVEAVATKAAPSVREQFVADLTKFRKEMGAITETQAHAETARLAERLGYTLDDLKNVIPGQALDEKQMLAYLKALEPQVDQLVTLARRTVAEGTEEAANAMARHAAEFFTVAPKFRAAEVTAGRAVEILKETPPMKRLTDMLMGWDHDSLAKGDFQGAIKTMAEDITAMADEPDKLKALAIASQSGFARFQEKWWPRFREAYINLIFARPITQMRNAVGSAVAGGIDVMERTIGGAFGIDKAKGLVPREGLYMLKDMRLAVGDGLGAFAKSYTQLDARDIGKLDYPVHQIPGKIGRVVNLPVDTIRGMDNLFKAIFRRGSYYATAIRDAVHGGLTTADDIGDFVARRVANPTEAMKVEGDAVALVNTFQNELGAMGNKLSKTLQWGPFVYYFPVMKTPIRLAKYAWARTPGLQLMSKSLFQNIAAGGVKGDMAIGRLTLSNLMGLYYYELAQEGLITGSGPIDPALRASWLPKHMPYSIRTNEGWRPISNFEPANTLPGLVADFAQIINQLDEPEAEQISMAILFAGVRNFADKTYWKTFGDLADLTASIRFGEEPGQKAARLARGPLTTIATGGPLIAATTRAIDPVMREARTFLDERMAKRAGYSHTVPAVRDGYGDPVLSQQAYAIGGPWVGIVSPFALKPHETDRVKLEGARLQAKLPRFPFRVGWRVADDFDLRAPQPGDKLGVALSPQQRDRWQAIYQRVLRHPELGIEGQVLNRNEYQSSTLAAQRETFTSYLYDAKAIALDALMVEDQELGKKSLEQEAANIAPLLQRQDQEALQQQTTESINLFDTLAPEQRDNLLRWGILESESEDGPTP